MNLTKNAISMISSSVDVVRPILQVNDVKLVNTSQSSTERYRMVLSDGVHMQQAMLATQLNVIVKEGKLMKGSIVQLNEFICNIIQGRRIIIVISLDVLVDKLDPIGDPKNYDNSSVPPQNRTSMPISPSIPDHQLQQQNMHSANPQPYVKSHSTSPVSQQNMMTGISVNPRPSYNGTTNSLPGVNMGNAVNDSYINGGAQNQRFSTMSNTSNTAYRPPGNPYGRPNQQMYQPPPPTYTNRGPISKNEAPARIIPISALNPYQGRWTIKARVTAKGELRHYNNPRGEGKVFSFDLLDSEGGEIRATCFNQVADQFYDVIETGRVYMLSKGTLKPARKDFNHLNNEYEISIESTSTIQPCPEEDSSIPKQQFNFRPIIEIETMENNSMVDLIGIVSSITPTGSIMRKNGTETHKRTLQLKDMSGRSVEITLWGNLCTGEGQQLQELCDSGNFPVLAIKTGRVSDFSGKSVGSISSSQLFINPDFPEAHELIEWFSREGKNIAAPSISKDSPMGKTDTRKTVAQIKEENLGRSEKADWVTVKATVSFVKTDNFCYNACPLMVGDRQCSKKVINNGDGTWHCERCDSTVPECDYRYLISLQIQDHTGMTWVTAFQETGEEIMGAPAKKLHFLKNEEQDEAKFAEIIRNVLFNQYLFKLKVKEETYSDEQRVKLTAVKAERVNPSSESRYLLSMIEKLSADSSSVPNMAMPSMPNVQPVNYNQMTNSSVKMEQTNQTGYSGGFMNNSQQFCSGCGMSGHSVQNCPRGMSRQANNTYGGDFGNNNRVSNDGGNVCFKCQQPGHWARDCPGVTGGRMYR